MLCFSFNSVFFGEFRRRTFILPESFRVYFFFHHFLILVKFLCCREEPVAAEAPAPVLGEPMDIMTALQMVLRKSLAHGGLARGLHEGAKVIEKHAAQLCVLAEDCDQPDYVKLVKALCADHNVNLITVPSAKTLGEWSGVSKRLYYLLRISFSLFTEIFHVCTPSCSGCLLKLDAFKNCIVCCLYYFWYFESCNCVYT